ncbi:MAG: Iron-sulfur cluster-binding protein [Clostridiales bacterium]|jgi:epoxyqueuosine reductase QueG|nr:Iron-sulfur cluster-binding protein [Clostridiales bacterium]
MELAQMITRKIISLVREADTVTEYRKPLVGFASAHDGLFTKMKEIIGPHHMQPWEILPEAKTVVAFFLPFAEDVVKANKKTDGVAKEWAVAYIETNKLIENICRELKKDLISAGIAVANEKATHNFDEETLKAGWSHKSAAYIAGLGNFGVHRMLITPAGCAGRFGSLIISAEIPPSSRPSEKYCLYYKDKKCLFCVNNCPTKALTVANLDKHRCYRHLLEIDSSFPDLGLCDVCGKCATGPCAFYKR